MADISLWVSLAERSLRRLRSDRTVLGFTITHDGDEPRLAVTVAFQTNTSSPDFNPHRLETVTKQVRSALPASIPFQIVTSRLTQVRGVR